MAWDRDSYTANEIHRWEMEKMWRELADKFFITDVGRFKFMYMNADVFRVEVKRDA